MLSSSGHRLRIRDQLLVGSAIFVFLFNTLLIEPAYAFDPETQKNANYGAHWYEPECFDFEDAAKVDNLKELPLREKLAQLLMPRVDSNQDIDTAVSAKVGGYFVGRNSILDVSAKIKETQSDTNPFLVSIDGEGGTVGTPLYSNPPAANELGALSNDEVREIASAFSEDLKGAGVNMDLAPVMDVTDDLTNGVIKTRSFSGDPDVVFEKGNAFAAGLVQKGVIPTFKHFPGHGHATKRINGTQLADSHAEDAFTGTLTELRNGDMKPFIRIAGNSPSAIMVGHLFIEGLNEDRPATLSEEVIDGVLRDELIYEGLVITDDLGQMAPITSRYPQLPEAVFQAIKAGNDMALFNGGLDQLTAIVDRLEQAVTAGELTEERIDQSIQRIEVAKTHAVAGGQGDADGDCACGGDGLVGADNAEKIFNYFVNKDGYEPFHAAGILGNMQGESAIEPQRLQGTAQGVVTPAEDVGGTSLGWGLVQWTPAGKMINPVTAAGQDPNDLEVQLNFLYGQLEGDTQNGLVPEDLFETRAGELLKAATTVDQATEEFEVQYERHAGVSGFNYAGAKPERKEFARNWLTQFGSGSSTSTGSSTCNENTGEYSLPMDQTWYDQNPDWFTKPHHDYPAADIPVPTGTEIYSMSSGTIVSAPTGGACGTGLVIDAGDGVQFIYCHGSDGGSVPGAAVGDQVEPGQLIMHSASTGRSTGPHLHLGLKINDVNTCPQNLFVGIVEGNIPDLNSLPTSGCSY